MNEVVSVGFDKVRLCLFVFVTVMLSFPLWLITIPLAKAPSGNHWIWHSVFGVLFAGALAPIAALLPGLFITYKAFFGFEFLQFTENMNMVAVTVGFWSGTLLACFVQLWMWPLLRSAWQRKSGLIGERA